MRRPSGWIVVLATALVLSGCGGGGSAASDALEDRVRQNIDALRASDYSKVWNEFLTPAARMACPESSYLAIAAGSSQSDRLSRIEIEDLSANVDGSRGTLSYRVTVDGSTLSTVEADVWEKVDGTWYDVPTDSEVASCQAAGG